METTMAGLWARLKVVCAAAMVALPLAACGVNNVPRLEEQAKAAWGEVQNQYQRRADLIPNLVETVKGYAQQEKDVLTQVTEARAKATSVRVDASTITDPAKFKEFQDAQNQLSGALGRLLATVEAYPDLKSNANFLALQSQLEGTENRIAVARRDYIGTVREYNTELRTIPGRWIAAIVYPDAKPMEVFTASAGSDRPPAVKF
jgi:LemA protein